MQNAKLLLTTIFRPYGVKDQYAEGLGMQMELFNNQITREQGVHSPRASFWTFPLYFLAENISVPSVVLDFPAWYSFVKELRNGYTHVGISFIVMNWRKARRMAEYVRKHYPETRIILGGYGTSLPDLAERVPHDDVCEGEGINWLREYFNEDKNQPFQHPVVPVFASHRIYGFNAVTDHSAMLVPGLGCANACEFCATTHKYGKKYIPLLKTGKDVFEVCKRAEEQMNIRAFGIMDENFLSGRDRAAELLACMEEEEKAYTFPMFSSAGAVSELGIDFLVRLGVSAVWIGIESREPLFDKMSDIDAVQLVEELRENGITVITSSILFLSHHDPETLQDEINWAVELGSCFHQFMQLVPLPGTRLHQRAADSLIEGFPETKLHGQDVLSFNHQSFDPEEANDITREAFRRKYERQGPGVLRMAHTILRGYEKSVGDYQKRKESGLAWNPESLRYDKKGEGAKDRFMEARIEQIRRRAEFIRPVLLASRVYSPNRTVMEYAAHVEREFRRVLGPAPFDTHARSFGAVLTAAAESVRIHWAKISGHDHLPLQPPEHRREYRI